MEIFNRNYIKDMEDFMPKSQMEEEFKMKAIELKRRLKTMKDGNNKI